MLKILFLIVAFSFCGYSSIDEVIDFKKSMNLIISSNNIVQVFHIGTKVDDVSAKLDYPRDTLFRKIDEAGLDLNFVEWFKRKFFHREKISHKEFAAAIFYPYEIIVTSYKYHISQMNCAFKACIYYCSKFDLDGPGSLIEKGLNAKNSAEIKKDETLLKKLAIAFPFNDSAFVRRAKEYLKKPENSGRLFDTLMTASSAVQSLNLGRLLNASGRTDLGRPLLSKAISQGAMQIEEEGLLSLLDIAFIANNGAFIEKAKAYLSEADNLDRLYARIMGEGSASQLLSFGLILKNMGMLDQAVDCFRNAASKNSQKAILELAYYDVEAGQNVIERLSQIGPYGFWKIA